MRFLLQNGEKNLYWAVSTFLFEGVVINQVPDVEQVLAFLSLKALKKVLVDFWDLKVALTCDMQSCETLISCSIRRMWYLYILQEKPLP